MMGKPKKGVSVLAISLGKGKPPSKEESDEGVGPDSEEQDEFDAESAIKDDLASALESKDSSALYDAIVAIVEKCRQD